MSLPSLVYNGIVVRWLRLAVLTVLAVKLSSGVLVFLTDRTGTDAASHQMLDVGSANGNFGLSRLSKAVGGFARSLVGQTM